MQLILREDVPSLGRAGEVVKVRDGYGRNFLLPQKKAMLANPENLKALEVQRKIIEKNRKQLIADAQQVAARLVNVEITLAREAGANDRLFGSVTKMDLVEALEGQGLKVDKHFIELDSPIKALGAYEISVKFHSEVAAPFKLNVVKQGE